MRQDTIEVRGYSFNRERALPTSCPDALPGNAHKSTCTQQA
jgi:hypothetical protein